MKKNVLCGAVLGAICMAQSAMAQEFDSRWYFSGTVGLMAVDSARNADSDIMYGIGVGKRMNNNFSLDLELDRANLSRNSAGSPNWDLSAVSVVGRVYFPKEGRTWNPYLVGAVGVQDHDDDLAQPIPAIGGRKGSNMLLRVGAGAQGDFDRISVRTEVGNRWDFDEDGVLLSASNKFADFYASVSLLLKIGSVAAAPAPAPAPMMPAAAPQVSCSDLDDDGDGVNNCNDKCPNSQAGQAIGADGCPVQLTIDLKGVNFDFDKDTLRPDAVAILDEAVSILQRYPQLRVEVAGHTDSVGTDAYNQNLSQARAKVVYDYLGSHGVDAGRLVGPNGFGESRPIDTNDTDAGRARNRRTELNVQN